ncbi:MAG: class II aldolase/adducin family protein [Syntrophorhabdaceae bacterium]|nr:class II aldolase/adducin family protein [Syntrophorhabdaceae bacterium]
MEVKISSIFCVRILFFLLVISFFVSPMQGTSFAIMYNPNPKTAKEAIEQVVWANRILANEGILDDQGHVTVRNPENPNTFFIARGNAPETVTKDDIIEVDFEGNIVTKTKYTTYSEWPIHGRIYKARPDVNAIVHAHPRQAIVLSVLDLPFIMLTHLSSMFYEGVPNYDGYDFESPDSTGMLVKKKEEGDRMAKTLGKSMAMLMRGHGCVVVGKSIPHAVQASLVLRENIAIQLEAQRFGKPKGLSREEAIKAFKALGGPAKGWEAWVLRVKKAMPDMR